MADEAIKVAVRVRPFNQREKDKQAKLTIQMKGQMTMIYNLEAPKEEPKKFTFDYSYWSHDGFTTEADGTLVADKNSRYASQRVVFDDLGKGVLNNAFQGYNCSLFAYGQTGSGKSYSLIGYGPNKGIVPITCNELFKAIELNNNPDKRYEVTFSMLEIYNEQVRDLLSKENPKGGLQVRQRPDLGSFYVQGLNFVPVGSYREIEKRMQQGTASRTVASTNMNATSSRAHTLVTITFDQFIKSGSSENRISSVMNLVDLAGSERADSTGATGDRLKEGANINKSLSALGNVISALADSSSGKKKVVVPYRDSILTKLLQNALGGNSKTIMIAALSPADINYDETLSTLRYADRAKRIKNKAVVNEDPMDKLIRELREENERLKEKINSGNFVKQIEVTKEMSPAEIEKLRKRMLEEAMEQLKSNQEKIVDSEQKEKSWSKKLTKARAETLTSPEDDKRRQHEAHLVNLNEDLLLSGVVYHNIRQGLTTVGRKDSKTCPDIAFNGLSIMKNHAEISRDKEVVLKPMPGAKVKVNGLPISEPKTLKHKDRILFGSNHLYVFMDPSYKGHVDGPEVVTWEFAQREIAQAQGFTTSDMSALSRDKQITQEQVLETLPMISEVNAISEELNKYKSFDVVLVALDAYQGINMRANKVMVQMKDLLTGNIWLWERGKFVNRRYIMQDLYQTMLDGDIDVTTISQDEDPFWEPIEDLLLGSSNIFLQSLAYVLDFEDDVEVRNFKGSEEGKVKVHLVPCNSNGRILGEENYVENPKLLMGKPFYFKVLIKSVDLLNPRHKEGVYIKYSVKGEGEEVKTEVKKGTKPQIGHSHLFSFPSISEHHLEFFENGCITFFVFVIQCQKKVDPNLAKLSTKELRQLEQSHELETKKASDRKKSLMTSQDDLGLFKSEMFLIQRKCERLEQKEKRLQEICRDWERRPDKSFEPFFTCVNALAFSNGRKLKARVQLVTKPLGNISEEGSGVDDFNVFVFGEHEKELEKQANDNGGYLPHKTLNSLYGASNLNHLIESKRLQERRKSIMQGKQPLSLNNSPSSSSPSPSSSSSSSKVQTSRACILQ